jgi:ribonucleotide reductase alpha subunit
MNQVIIQSLKLTKFYKNHFEEKELHQGVTSGAFVHNCGEVDLPPDSMCDLGSINLTKFIKIKQLQI